MASLDLRDELDCSICLNLYTDPVTLRCGHNFCRGCIDQALDTQDGSGVYSCPECRMKFKKRPGLKKNQKLHNIVERFTSTESRMLEDSGICCTYCVDSAVPAVKSCLHCEASLCDKHLRAHSRAAEHVLTDPSTSLEKRKCSVHKKVLEYYCIEDATCICVSCSLTGLHKGHQLELLKEASAKRQEQLRKVEDNLVSKKEENTSRIQTLHQHTRNVNDKAGVVSRSISNIFMDIRGQVDHLEKKVLSEISRQEKQMSLSVSDLIQQLEMENRDLSKTICSVNQMRSTMDPLIVLKDQELLTSDVRVMDNSTRDDVHAVGDLNILTISKLIHETMERIVQEMKSRGFNKPEATNILLDVATAGNDVAVSEDFKTASWPGFSQNRPDTPETFQTCQVLSKDCFSSGKHFLEVESSDGGDWCVGMSYSNIDRKGEQCIIGQNDKSWALRLWSNQYTVIHDSNVIQLPAKPSGKKLGLYLDYEAGQLSFYELCDFMRHLYTFKADFTEPLHVLCWVLGSSLCFGSGNDGS